MTTCRCDNHNSASIAPLDGQFACARDLPLGLQLCAPMEGAFIPGLDDACGKGDYRCVLTSPDCEEKYCTSPGNDCCAPSKFSEAATCGGGMVPLWLGPEHGMPCFGQPDGAYTCCPPRESSEAGQKYAVEYTLPPYQAANSVAQARQLCAQQGGVLASVTSSAINQQLLALILRYKRDRATIGGLLVNGQWGPLGVQAWQGQHSVPWKYENWAGGQPDDDRDQCVEMWTTGEWNDFNCADGPKPYLCEVRVPPADFTFACSPGVARHAGKGARCRFEVSAFTPAEKTPIVWEVARRRCAELGGGASLAEPRTALQNQWLASRLRQHGSESMWLGLRKDNDGFFWESDKSRLADSESRWANTEPNGVPGDCVEMWEDGTWNDRACDIGKVLACEVVV